MGTGGRFDLVRSLRTTLPTETFSFPGITRWLKCKNSFYWNRGSSGGTGLTVQEFHLQERIRIYALAKELDLESKDLIDLCRQAGIDVKNQLSSLDPDQRDAVVQLVKRGGGGVAVAAPPKQSSAGIPQVMTPVPV